MTQFIATTGGGSGVADSNTFQITLDASGTVEVNYGALGATDGLVGYSPGNGVVDPGSLDFSTINGYQTGTGVPSMELLAGARPILGGPPATGTMIEIPASAVGGFGAYLLGVQVFNPGLPLDVIGMEGCQLANNGNLGSIPFIVTGTTDSSLSLPVSGSLQGVVIGVQGAVIAPGVNTLGVATSNGLAWTLDTM